MEVRKCGSTECPILCPLAIFEKAGDNNHKILSIREQNNQLLFPNRSYNVAKTTLKHMSIIYLKLIQV